MPRLPRVRVEGAIYYVTSRAAQNEVIFKDKEDYRMYLELINKYKSQHAFRLYAYCLLPNRLELLVETGEDASLSELMHHLNSLYTKYFNARYQRRGHLFESRFRSMLVEKSQYLLPLTRHIHRQAESTHPHSSFLIYMGRETGSLSVDMASECREVLDFLKKKDDSAAYDAYVLQGDPQEIEILEKSLRRGQVLGSDEFKARVMQAVEKRVEEKQEERTHKTSPIILYFIGAVVLMATASSVYFYVSREKIVSKYEELLKAKDAEFVERSSFENRSPIALSELEGTVWRIEKIRLPAGKAKEAVTDTLTFSEGKFRSGASAELGFSPTNVSVTRQPDGVTIWETVQSNAAGDTMSWRGDWHGDLMRGVVSYVRAGQSPQDFSFYSLEWSYVSEPGRVPAEGGAR